MASIIKNQILKHLSRFVKNLSSDKISLSTLRGEGELSNLELDEEVLTELLALPTWMKLTHAKCNKACIRIQWTKLKSVPILLSLDEVTIRVEACEELRTVSAVAPTMPASTGKYGFVNKVIDGITCTVNSVEIQFNSREFESKVQISRIRVESQSPTWKKVELSGTRLKCMERGETLIFKAMEWQTLRLEARSKSERGLAPLRLLTNQAKAQIVIKKKLSDAQVVGCRLSLILDDLLWVLTDSQIIAALHFMSSLSGLIKQATELTQRFKAARKLESLPEYQAQLSQTTAMRRELRTDAAKTFETFDVKETSYHFICEKIDLHFCDDPGKGRSKHDKLKDGGALQLSLVQVVIDFYPYHLARGDRRAWPKYADNTLYQWLTQSLSQFRIALIEAVSSSMHSPLARTQNQVSSPGGDSNPVNPIRTAVTEQFGKLMTTCLILKIQDVRMYKVTTSSKQLAPQLFLSSYIDRPKDLHTVHAEFTWFYYPGEICFPLPSPKFFAHLYPFQVHLDVCTVLWLNCFASNLMQNQNVISLENNNPSEPDYVDVRVELIMPKVVFENKKPYPNQKERPQSLHFQVSRLVVSNYRSSDTGSLHQLTQCIELLQRGDLAYGSDFPAKNHDVPLIAEKFVAHAEGRDKIREVIKINCTSFQEISRHLTKDMMKTEPRDVWYIFMDPFWADFRVDTKKKKKNPSGPTPNNSNISSGGNSRLRGLSERSQSESSSTQLYPFIDSLPVSLWVYQHEEDVVEKTDQSNNPPGNNVKANATSSKVPSKKKTIKALFNADGICNVQLTHYQYLFVMRMVEAFSEMSLYLTYDLEQILGQSVYENIVTALGFIPTVELSLLFPPVVPGVQGSPSMDLDSSGVPESSSGENEDNQGEKENAWKLVEREREKKPSIFVPENLEIPIPTPSMSMSSSPISNSVPSFDSFRTSFSQVKHGFSSLAVSFNKVGVSTPDSEVASQCNWSSGSSENNFVPIETLDEDFDCAIEATEVALEAQEDNRSTPSPSFSFGNHIIRAENDNSVSSIGVLTVRLDNVEAAQEIKGLNSKLKLQCRSVSLMECTGMPWNEFQTKFAARNRKWANQVSTLGSPTQKRVIKIRLTQKIDIKSFISLLNTENVAMREAIIDSTAAFLEGHIDLRNEEPFTLHMSTVTALTDFVEDEILPSPFPLQIAIIGASLVLIEDRPSANITSPGPSPLKFSIPNLLPIFRDKYGAFQIGSKGQKPLTGTIQSMCNSSSQSKNVQPKETSYSTEQNRSDLQVIMADCEKFQKQLDVLQQRNNELERELQETQFLKGLVLSLQEQVQKLQEEKLQLLNLRR